MVADALLFPAPAAVRTAVSRAADADRSARALALRHAREGVSFAGLKRGMRHFFAGPDAVVAYADTGSAWVAAGGPLAAPGSRDAVAAAFAAAAAAAGRRAVFCGVEEGLQGFSSFAIGAQPVWDPAHWAERVRGNRSLREQLRRARNKGVATRQLCAADLADLALRRELESLVEEWLAQRATPPLGFVVAPQPFYASSAQRYVVAEQQGRVVGLLAMVPLAGRDGWLFEDVIRVPRAPNGTAELLIDAAFAWCADAAVVTLGLVPLAGDVPTALRWLGRCCRFGYDFDGLLAFRRKLQPDRWEPVSIACAPSTPAPLALIDVLRAVARGSLWRFALAAVRRTLEGMSLFRALAL